MKKLFRKFVIKVLALEAKLLLWRKKPDVIGITGSAGKTSTKEFLRKLLEIDFEVLAPEEGYNTEFGAPLALFSEKVPRNVKSVSAWILLLVRLFFKALFIRDYPQKVIIEMGADKPGDIKYLCKIFKPKTGIILAVLSTHLEEFKSEIGVAAEKGELAKAVPEGGKLFLNYDDPKVRPMESLTKGRVIFFGKKKGAFYVAEKVNTDLLGTEFEMHHHDQVDKILVRLYGKHMIYPIIAAIAVACEEGVSIRKIKDELKEVTPFKGRMNLIEGINGSIIIDDTYNANPESMKEALEFLYQGKGRRIAILGSMNELGDVEQEAHEKVGRIAAKCADLVITIGESAQKYLAPAALKEGMKLSQVRSFKTAVEAGNYLKGQIKEGDIILAKGSQNNVRAEKAVEIIMNEPMDRKKLLVRQSEFWQDN